MKGIWSKENGREILVALTQVEGRKIVKILDSEGLLYTSKMIGAAGADLIMIRVRSVREPTYLLVQLNDENEKLILRKVPDLNQKMASLILSKQGAGTAGVGADFFELVTNACAAATKRVINDIQGIIHSF